MKDDNVKLLKKDTEQIFTDFESEIKGLLDDSQKILSFIDEESNLQKIENLKNNIKKTYGN